MLGYIRKIKKMWRDGLIFFHFFSHKIAEYLKEKDHVLFGDPAKVIWFAEEWISLLFPLGRKHGTFILSDAWLLRIRE